MTELVKTLLARLLRRGVFDPCCPHVYHKLWGHMLSYLLCPFMYLQPSCSQTFTL